MDLEKIGGYLFEINTLIAPTLVAGMLQGFGLGAVVFAEHLATKILVMAITLFVGFFMLKKVLSDLVENEEKTSDALNMELFKE